MAAYNGSEQVRLHAISFLRKDAGPYQQQLRAMAEFRFDPPLTLKGNIVVRNLDDAVRFMIGYREARRPELQTSVLYRKSFARRQRGLHAFEWFFSHVDKAFLTMRSS